MHHRSASSQRDLRARHQQVQHQHPHTRHTCTCTCMHIQDKIQPSACTYQTKYSPLTHRASAQGELTNSTDHSTAKVATNFDAQSAQSRRRLSNRLSEDSALGRVGAQVRRVPQRARRLRRARLKLGRRVLGQLEQRGGARGGQDAQVVVVPEVVDGGTIAACGAPAEASS